MGHFLVKMADKSSNCGRGVKSTHNVVAKNFRFAFFGDGFGHDCFQEAWKNGVHPHAVATISLSEICG